MALRFKTLSVSGKDLQKQNVKVTFDNTVNDASVCIQSFNFDYGDDTDQYIDTVFIKVSNIQPKNADNSVSFNWEADMGAEDNSTTSGDRTSITFLIIADVAAS